MAKRSDNVTKGVERAPMRSLFYAMGYTKEELERPLIGVVSAHSEIVPGHINLDKITMQRHLLSYIRQRALTLVK